MKLTKFYLMRIRENNTICLDKVETLVKVKILTLLNMVFQIFFQILELEMDLIPTQVVQEVPLDFQIFLKLCLVEEEHLQDLLQQILEDSVQVLKMVLAKIKNQKLKPRLIYH